MFVRKSIAALNYKYYVGKNFNTQLLKSGKSLMKYKISWAKDKIVQCNQLLHCSYLLQFSAISFNYLFKTKKL